MCARVCVFEKESVCAGVSVCVFEKESVCLCDVCVCLSLSVQTWDLTRGLHVYTYIHTMWLTNEKFALHS